MGMFEPHVAEHVFEDFLNEYQIPSTAMNGWTASRA